MKTTNMQLETIDESPRSRSETPIFRLSYCNFSPKHEETKFVDKNSKDFVFALQKYDESSIMANLNERVRLDDTRDEDFNA